MSAAERVVPARVEDHQIQARPGDPHLAQYQVQVRHLKVNVGFTRRICVDWHKIVRTADLNAMPGVVKQRDLGTLQLLAKGLDCRIESGLVEVQQRTVTNHSESQFLQCARHQHGIILRVVEMWDALIGGIADHERDALFGSTGASQRNADQ
jgi:hypothetical protein